MDDYGYPKGDNGEEEEQHTSYYSSTKVTTPRKRV